MMMPGNRMLVSSAKTGTPRKLIRAWPATCGGGGAPVEGQHVPDGRRRSRLWLEASTAGDTEGDQRGDHQRLAHGHQPAERVRPDGRGRQDEAGDLVEHDVGEVERGEQPCRGRTCALALSSAEARVVGMPDGRRGAVGGVARPSAASSMKDFAAADEWREVIGEGGTEALIGRRRGDRASRSAGRGWTALSLGDFEIVGAGGRPAEGRLLHLACEQIEIAVAGLRWHCPGWRR